MSIQSSNHSVRINDGGANGVNSHQDTPESLKTEPDDQLLPILTNSHNYQVI